MFRKVVEEKEKSDECRLDPSPWLPDHLAVIKQRVVLLKAQDID